MRKKYFTLFVLPIFSLSLVLGVQAPAFAADASAWRAGRIIDDSLFTNPNDMSVADIQNFLNAKVPVCDTWGTQKATEYGSSLTHAQYAASRGWPGPPYVCLRDYYEVPKTTPSSSAPVSSYTNNGTPPPNSVSAAQMIFNAAQRNGISNKALLIKIATESRGPLTGDNWPLQSQYTYAMGAHCPDSGPNGAANCDPNYAGFSIQVSEAAALLRGYLDNMTQPWWPYKKPFQNNNVLWQNAAGSFPNPSGVLTRYDSNANGTVDGNDAMGCGYGSVYLESRATAALYTYTPYQPNSESLNKMYTTGDSCSSYGNRNFWRTWVDWFGATNYTPVPCDAKALNATCVWQLHDNATSGNFLTTSSAERDSAVYNHQFIYDGMSFYAYKSPAAGTLPVYRVKLPNEHFYTTNVTEKNALLQSQANSDEGIAFYAYPASTSNAAYPVYRLNGASGHIFTKNVVERDRFISQGYSYEGIAFSAPSGFAVSTPIPTNGNNNVYRMNGPREHLYTASLDERDALLKAGWSDEGILLEVPQSATSQPVYRLLNSSGYHIFTSSDAERSLLLGKGWSDEGVAWYTSSASSAVYRFYIAGRGEHFYTSNINEAFALTNRGAAFEGTVTPSPSTTPVPVYRFSNGAGHHFTANLSEAMSIANNGWGYEGVAWYGSTSDTSQPVYRLYDGKRHFFTSSVAEKNALLQASWRDEGIGWYAAPGSTSQPVYRLYNGSWHFFTSSAAEKNIVSSSGWRYEGISWYSP